MIGPASSPTPAVNGITYDEGSYRESLDLAEEQVRKRAGRRSATGCARQGCGRASATPASPSAPPTAPPTMSQRRMRMTPGYDTAHGPDGPDRRGHRHHRDLRARPGARDHVRADRRRPPRRPPGPGPAAPGRHRPGLLRLGHLGQPFGGDRRRRGRPGRRQRRRPAAAGGRAASWRPARPTSSLAAAPPGSAATTRASIPITELARMVHFQAHRLAEDLRYALEARATFDPPGTFSNACHAAMVVIDPGTCAIRLHRYLVVEDCGVVINPVMVDGQVRGGVTQGVAAALLERVCFDADGQPWQRHADGLPGADRGGDVPGRRRPPGDPLRGSARPGPRGWGRAARSAPRPPSSTPSTTRCPTRPGAGFDHIPVLPHELRAALARSPDEGHAPDPPHR